MKISKKYRYAAIEQLEQFADVWLASADVSKCRTSDLCALAGETVQAISRSGDLFIVTRLNNSVVYAHVFLEAAALLRDGWEPGEPLERIQ